MGFPFPRRRRGECMCVLLVTLVSVLALSLVFTHDAFSSMSLVFSETPNDSLLVQGAHTAKRIGKKIRTTPFMKEQESSGGTFGQSTHEEKHDLVFLKTHKTGSSTIANILQRFGLSRQLNFALPKKTPGEVRYNYFGDLGETLQKKKISSSKRNSSSYNLLYNHVIFNVTAFERVFRPYTTYITILRDPLTQFQSAILYFIHQEQLYRAAVKNLSEYLEHPGKYEPTEPYYSFTDNRQSLDLGVPPARVRDLNYIKDYTEILDRKFDLVMIMEKFDESLVMLRRIMFWSIKDIIYIRKNTGYSNISLQFSAHDRKLHRKWALSDHEIYGHFLRKFNRELYRHYNSIMEEVYYFKGILSRTQFFCSASNRSRLHVPESKWNQEFYVTSLDCAYMRLGELNFLNKLLKMSVKGQKSIAG